MTRIRKDSSRVVERELFVNYIIISHNPFDTDTAFHRKSIIHPEPVIAKRVFITDWHPILIMPCGLTDMEIHILYILYRFKNFKSNAGYHREKLKKILRKKYSQDFDDAISKLKNEGFISTVKKQEPKFYILDISQTYSVLKDHGYNVTPLGGGRVHHID